VAIEAPRLRHEFVGMMFAITVGEIGLQAAALVQDRQYLHFLPAYSHLFLATFVVALSWVGWSKSAATQDVGGVLEWPFVVLLLDMAMVVTYFILVRTIDFSPEGHQRIDSAADVAYWHILIFSLYFVWDIVTKIVMYRPAGISPTYSFKFWVKNFFSWGKHGLSRTWWRKTGIRMTPTLLCLVISIFVWFEFAGADEPHWLTADFALLCLVLLFRSLKECLTTRPPDEVDDDEQKARAAEAKRLFKHQVAIGWTVVLVIGLIYGTAATRLSWTIPLPRAVVNAIHAGPHR